MQPSLRLYPPVEEDDKDFDFREWIPEPKVAEGLSELLMPRK